MLGNFSRNLQVLEKLFQSLFVAEEPLRDNIINPRHDPFHKTSSRMQAEIGKVVNHQTIQENVHLALQCADLGFKVKFRLWRFAFEPRALVVFFVGGRFFET